MNLEEFQKFSEMLKNFPLWILLALSMSGLIVIYCPNFLGLPLDFVRNWNFTGILTLLFCLLSIFKIASNIFNSIFSRWKNSQNQRSLSLTVDAQSYTHWWKHTSNQNRLVTEMVMEVSAYNNTSVPIGITAARLINPKVRAEQMLPIKLLIADKFNREASRDIRILTRTNA